MDDPAAAAAAARERRLVLQLAAFDRGAREAVRSLDAIVASIDRVETVCAPVTRVTEQLRRTHANVQAVHDMISNVERWSHVAEEVDACLAELKGEDAANASSPRTQVPPLSSSPPPSSPSPSSPAAGHPKPVARHDRLDAAVAVLVDAEAFLRQQDFLPDGEALAHRVAEAKASCCQWYLGQLSLVAGLEGSGGVAATPGNNARGALSDDDDARAASPGPAEATCASVPASAPALCACLVKLGCGRRALDTYCTRRSQVVRRRFQGRVASQSAARAVRLLCTLFAEEAHFLKAVFGAPVVLRGGDDHNDRDGGGGDGDGDVGDVGDEEDDGGGGGGGHSGDGASFQHARRLAQECLAVVVRDGAVVPFRTSVKQSMARCFFSQDDHAAVLAALDARRARGTEHLTRSSLHTSSSSSSDGLDASARLQQERADAAIRSAAERVFRSLLPSAAPEAGGGVEEDVQQQQQPTLFVSVCELAMKADVASEQIRSSVTGMAQAMRGVTVDGLGYGRTVSRQWVRQVLALMERPGLIGDEIVARSGRRGPTASGSGAKGAAESASASASVSPVTRLVLRFATEMVKHKAVGRLVREGADPHQYVLGVCTALKTAILAHCAPAQTLEAAAAAVGAAAAGGSSGSSPAADAARLAVGEAVAGLAATINNLHYAQVNVFDLDYDGKLAESIDGAIAAARARMEGLLTDTLVEHSRMPVENMPSDLAGRKTLSATSPFCRELKRRFAAMNSLLDAVAALAVPPVAGVQHTGARAALAAALTAKVEAHYAPFYATFAKVPFSKKHLAQYTRWAPRAAVEVMVTGSTK